MERGTRIFAGLVVGFFVFAVSLMITGATGNVAYAESGVLRSLVYLALFARNLGGQRRKVCLAILTMDMAFGAVVAQAYDNQGWVFGFLLIGILESLVYLWVSSSKSPNAGARRRHFPLKTSPNLGAEVKR